MRGFKSLVARAIVVLAVAGPLLMAYPTARARFLAASRTGATGWAIVHGVGVALLFVPLIRAGSGDLRAAFSAALGP